MMVMEMSYVEYTNLTSSAGSVASYQFRANDVYDPNYTGTGHQAKCFDEMMGIYSSFVVLASTCTVRIHPELDGVQASVVLGKVHNGTAPTSIINFAEEPESKSALVYYTDPPKELTSSWSGWKTYGKGFEEDDQNQGTSSSSPGEVHNYCLLATDIQLGTSKNIRAEWVLKYKVRFQELKLNAGS